MSATSDMVRKMFGEADSKRDAGLTTPEDILRYDDICYGTDAKWQVLDVYRPKDREGERLPVIVSVHGGGWMYGDKERYQFYCMNLAQRGFAVVNFTYRLAPEFQFPANIEDTNLVFTWVLAHADEYGFDTAHVFGVGDSAGAHNLGLYAAICTNPDCAKEYDFAPPKGFAPTAVALNCGSYRIALSEDPKDMTTHLMRDFLPEGGTDRELERIAVASYVTENYPPVFLMSASGDFLKPDQLLIAEKLSECDVPFVYRFYSRGKEPLGHVFHCNIRLAEAAQCNDDECDFFKTFCEGRKDV